MIRAMQEGDRELFLELAAEFYHSDAVLHPVPEEFHSRTFAEMMSSDRYLNGYILEQENQAAGYAITAKTFSQEAGGIVVWIDEIYILPPYRSKGLAREFFQYLESHRHPGIKRIRLEVEEENVQAISLYKRLGFNDLEYIQMIKDFD
ncbi:Acetyltransferases [Desulfitobacterium sp. LBE]|uniref:N-acetyltransferase domain-containing protein n=5 Tax=root TaxID=1 RepID=Q24VS2_DESHY|nr:MULTISPECIES: GNAT family N-acetyltransferase [Desulfitobacterium]ACL21265.1 GCN5-related N-acetyltransferase [Desulfitobacterium hafniense DCB-2]EHL06646.1 acetyltransferase, GNAT family [Desulfitobacterium hafniense DP7]KTE92687.1 GNAT family acetyltransferase [Desulfitobacterium hafniense]MEA5023005.1 GNAT family N-acetyltransferase [Desulfitobacterium hafniense]TWH55902.1 Acetyltransferases [Desulfitobacterium sp. LBE]